MPVEKFSFDFLKGWVCRTVAKRTKMSLLMTRFQWVYFVGSSVEGKILDRRNELRWESAHLNGILLADGFRNLPDGFLCWMLLTWVEAYEIPLGWAHS